MSSAHTKAVNRSAPGRPKSHEKRQGIMCAASRLFLRQGFERTSMELVAKESKVSKQTLYSHFANKEALYNAVIEDKCEFYRIDPTAAEMQGQSVEKALQTLAFKYIQLLQDSEVISMYRVVIAEAPLNKRMAELFYDAGPMHAVLTIVDVLHKHPQIQLPLEQAKPLAVDFFNLLKGSFHMQDLLNLAPSLNQAQQQAHAKQVSAKFIKLLPASKD